MALQSTPSAIQIGLGTRGGELPSAQAPCNHQRAHYRQIPPQAAFGGSAGTSVVVASSSGWSGGMRAGTAGPVSSRGVRAATHVRTRHRNVLMTPQFAHFWCLAMGHLPGPAPQEHLPAPGHLSKSASSLLAASPAAFFFSSRTS